MNVIYFSSVSENTHRFVGKLTLPAAAARISVTAAVPGLAASEPYLLITPTYGGGGRRGGDVPKQVIRFLNEESNRLLLRGVIAAGNTNFGADFCRAGEIIAAKCEVPLLHRFELLGTPEDVHIVNSILETNTYVATC